jgi:hypothetical protein
MTGFQRQDCLANISGNTVKTTGTSWIRKNAAFLKLQRETKQCKSLSKYCFATVASRVLTMQSWRDTVDHGLINYKDTKAKCRHLIHKAGLKIPTLLNVSPVYKS